MPIVWDEATCVDEDAAHLWRSKAVRGYFAGIALSRQLSDGRRFVTLGPEAVGNFWARHVDDEAVYVCPCERSKAGHIQDPRSSWERVLRSAGIADLRLHDLRRMLGSWQGRTGASLVVIGKSLNHRSREATAIYARLDLDPVRQSVERATSAMLEVAGIKQGADVPPFHLAPGGKKSKVCS